MKIVKMDIIGEASFLSIIRKADSDITILCYCGKYKLSTISRGLFRSPRTIVATNDFDLKCNEENVHEIVSICKKYNLDFVKEEKVTHESKHSTNYSSYLVQEIDIIVKIYISEAELKRILLQVEKEARSRQVAHEKEYMEKLLCNSWGEERIKSIKESDLFSSIIVQITNLINESMQNAYNKDEESFYLAICVDYKYVGFRYTGNNIYKKIYFVNEGYKNLDDTKTICSLQLAFVKYFIDFFYSHQICNGLSWSYRNYVGEGKEVSFRVLLNKNSVLKSL